MTDRAATVVRISLGAAAVVALVVLGVVGIELPDGTRDWLMAASGWLIGWMQATPKALAGTTPT